jgi:invasion protein IalB
LRAATEQWRLSAAGAAWLACAAATPAALAQTANPIEKHGDWTMFTAEAGGSKLCFVTAQPAESKPEGARRDPIHFYVSAWPKEGVKAEISVKLGYPLKKGSQPTVSVGPQSFKLFVKDDKAFVADPTAELKLIDAMKKGAKILVEATSERGTATSDTYSLTGFDKALQALSSKCT